MKPARLEVSAMTQADLAGVWAIEQTLTGPWTYDQLKDELTLPHGWHFVIRLPASAETKSYLMQAVETERHPPRTHPLSSTTRILGYIFGATILDEAEIRKIAVDREYRRQGLASILLTAVDQFLLASLVKECFLELRASNRIALTLYQKNGFQIVGQRKNYYTTPADDAILVKKQLITQVE
ncbi:MAG: ribosomal protein S18-alanine N-acetyltransferase [Desulfobulbaceae bacterium]|nr:ribosomal protein S18-alanine N-acetyltransferase [Desulfobulbaceae bacterium]